MKTTVARVTLEPVAASNFDDIVALDVADDQRNFVASNLESIAQAYVIQGTEPFGIRVNSRLIGFAMIHTDTEGEAGPIASIMRFMIDRNHQRKGYGRAAMRALIEHIANRSDIDAIEICVYPDNTPAIGLYESVGLRDTAEMYGKEKVYRLRLS